MKLFPPQVECRIYEEGFNENDLLGRTVAGKRLSELLEKVEDPIVLALDGPWGSGKTYFLKRWVGAHKIENGGVATTVYFDAFANDFLDDPLIALTGAIGDRLAPGKERGKWDGAKKVAVKLARPFLRIGAAVATAGATEFVGPVLDAAIEAGGEEAEKAAEAFWKREDGRKAAMLQFQTTLTELTHSTASDASDAKPLIVVIDELDRCRPDYALSVLEVLKHFFSVPRVHFVLGVNMDALEHIVRARYGAGINAADYLKRFISLSMKLPEHIDAAATTRAPIKYFTSAAAGMGIEPSLVDIAERQLRLAVEPAGLSLRDIEKILTRLVLLPGQKKFKDYHFGWQALIVSLVILQVMRPDLYRAALRQTVKIEEIDQFYGLKRETFERTSARYDHDAYLLHGVWQFALTGTTDNADDVVSFSRLFDNFGRRDAGQVLTLIERDFFQLFHVNE